ncbi:MAG TPA: family 1 glycosylhydrolase, partial [Daejeonella sp.]|nr:family 1 glycosylhydrolase [Daejeonella sp.]
YPPSIYHALKRVSGYPQIKEIIVTENGAAFTDEVVEGRVEDVKRVNFLKDHIEQVLLARREGVNVKGYFVWTLTDNFEWAEGLHPRFGLVHVDFQTQKRIIKASGRWYRDFIKREEDKT